MVKHAPQTGYVQLHIVMVSRRVQSGTHSHMSLLQQVKPTRLRPQGQGSKLSKCPPHLTIPPGRLDHILTWQNNSHQFQQISHKEIAKVTQHTFTNSINTVLLIGSHKGKTYIFNLTSKYVKKKKQICYFKLHVFP